MAKKSRYLGYVKGYQNMQKKKIAEPKSILSKLKGLKGQENTRSIPGGGMNGE